MQNVLLSQRLGPTTMCTYTSIAEQCRKTLTIDFRDRRNDAIPTQQQTKKLG